MGGRSGQSVNRGGQSVSDSDYDNAAKDSKYDSDSDGDNNEKTLNAYTNRGFLVNDALREGNLSEADKQFVKNMDKSLDRLPVDQTQELYRGVNLKTSEFNSIEKGTELNFKGYTSTTKDVNITDEFKGKNANKDNTPTVFKIRSHNTGKNIENFSEIRSEKEVLFGRNTRWKVVDKKDNVITIEQL